MDKLGKKIYDDWDVRVRKFIDNNLFQLVKNQIEEGD